MLGAMNLLLGDRHDAKVITDTNRKAVVEAQFDITRYQLAPFFEENDIDYDPRLCILRREILPNNRTRAFINDCPATLQQMKILTSQLIDIHSQSNNAMIVNPKFQISALDGLAANDLIRQEYAEKYKLYADASHELESLKERIASAKEEEDYNRFLLSQFDGVELHEGIEQELTALQLRLDNASDIQAALSEGHDALDGEDSSVISILKSAKSRIDNISPVFDSAAPLSERLESAIIELKDIASTLIDYVADVEADPIRLDSVNEHLAAIERLKRKHNVATAEELISIKRTLTEKISAVDGADIELSRLEKRVEELKADAEKQASRLSQSRREASQLLSAKIVESAATLALPNVRFDVRIDPKPLASDGADRATFLVAFNKNQPLMSVADTASGGEMSRLMLCLKSIIATTTDMPTLVLDEIDTGVSGQVAAKMAEMMARLSTGRQVIAITHLPQVAAKASAHYRVFKEDTADATATHIERLSEKQRLEEIAAMLSASDIDEAAIANAKSLINS